MKSIIQKLYLLLLLSIIITCNISANKSNWASLDLNHNEIRQSIDFQLTRGGTCFAEFEKLIPILDRFIQKKYNPNNLENILGVPNQIITSNLQTEMFYYLTSNMQKCELKIVVDKTKVLNYIITNCR
jgi:hypothetical protein